MSQDEAQVTPQDTEFTHPISPTQEKAVQSKSDSSISETLTSEQLTKNFPSGSSLFGFPVYFKCAGASKHTLEHRRDNSLIIEKRHRRILSMFSKKKPDEQTFIMRENGYVEAAMCPDYVLSCNIPAMKGCSVYIARKNPKDSNMNQKWLIKRDESSDRLFNIQCPLNPTLIVDRQSEQIGAKVVLMDNVESKWLIKPLNK
ncbi:hypothetical protein AKO1_013940 [Acrasis kona]|uniref:Ricin B lectin domain-containing protein n=1 Tax=Acrasis kona TaxID=1008807 RepID=A0AAW2Z2Z2_9EUKA